jgi:phosphate transport system permease protein
MADITMGQPPLAETAVKTAKRQSTDLSARGEPFVWMMGGALAIGLLMITGFLALIMYFGITTFWPKQINVVEIADGRVIAGEAFRTEIFRPTPDQLAAESEEVRARIAEENGFANRTLYRVGNFDLYGEDFVWVPEYDQVKVTAPGDFAIVERSEWGVFLGRIASMTLDGQTTENPTLDQIAAAHTEALARRARILDLKEHDITDVSKRIEELRLEARRAAIDFGADDPRAVEAAQNAASETTTLNAEFKRLNEELALLQSEDAKYFLTLAEVGGQTKDQTLSTVVRVTKPNEAGFFSKLGTYGSRWGEFITAQPREANTEGGVWPAIIGTLSMTVLLALAVAPFGVITALYLREYAKQGRLVSFVRICVNNLAGVPSIVYGVFGLGFFCYIVGGSIDQVFFPERLPAPTFGTGGLLWASLTLALLTVPVVIVATEEALAAVPRSMREGSLACGASKWQTIKWIVLPRALPGIMTGLILAMARGAGEVAPLMLVGVVKLAPELPIDLTFPFVHLDRSFMHLGFHIFDVGFQSRNSEAGRPMVFVTTLLLIVLILILNATAIYVRNRLKKRFQGSQF